MMKSSAIVLTILMFLPLISTAQPKPGENMAAVVDKRAEDREAIRALVDKIFRAFVEKDAATLKATHADDWAGYFSNSKTLTQTGDAYLKQVTARQGAMNGYKFEEFVVDFQGDIALVFYVADIEATPPTGEIVHGKVRSLDVYAKRNGSWIQIASNLATHPDTVADQASNPSPMPPPIRQQILDARGAVWRAWFANDQQSLFKLVTDETIAFQNGEKWQNKADFMASAKQFAESGAKLLRLDFPRTEIKMYGNTITLYTAYVFEIDVAGKRITKEGMGTESFILRNNEILSTGRFLTDTSK
jgi:ketosteroid isomerase-like protein